MTIHRYFVTAPRTVTPWLADEIRELGAKAVRVEPGGVGVRGPLSFGYRLCLWSRCASRVLLGLVELVAKDADALHRGILDIEWERHLRPDGTFAVDVVGEGAGIRNTKFGAQRVKDGIVDRFRARTGIRPSVDLDDPDVRIHVHVRGRGVRVSLDLAGRGLHRRGWREAAGEAPLKENLAAAILRRGGWAQILAERGPLVDPLCGSGTLVIEAASWAADVAPGLMRSRFGFERWLGHDAGAWDELCTQARARAEQGCERVLPAMVGFDADERILASARDNARRAGIGQLVRFEHHELSAGELPDGPGLIVTNPPHGERLGDKDQARRVCAALGAELRRRYEGWRMAVLTTDDDLPFVLGVLPEQSDALFNGAIASRLLTGNVSDPLAGAPSSPFANRMRKNLDKLRRWTRRNAVSCHRLYDADIPEYNVAIDRYESWIHLQEYAPPSSIDAETATRRLHEIVTDLARLLELDPAAIFVKQRRRRVDGEQYERRGAGGPKKQVREGDLRFWINLSDYLDTGLFLDHRRTRALIRELAKDRRFLNLFGYTGTATVAAAAGGARTTTTVDLSNTYLSWAQDNMVLNGLDGAQHRWVRDDVLAWLKHSRETFDFAFVDPPTHSRSKRMRGDFDVQRDHVALIEAVMRRLSDDGVLLFSTNARRFELDDRLQRRYRVEDLTSATIDVDFARTPRIHQCWRVTR